jgi:hypothetical protein
MGIGTRSSGAAADGISRDVSRESRPSRMSADLPDEPLSVVEVTGGIVIAKDDRNASALAMRDEVGMRHGQFPAIGHVDHEQLERVVWIN